MLGTWLLAEWVALVGGDVHTMLPGTEAAPATVLVRDGVVHALVEPGASYEEADSYRVVDATGKHLVPGLIDGLAYYHRDHDLLYVSAGVTLVVDHGNNLADIFNARDSVEGGPALFICGAVIDGIPATTNEALSISSPDAVPLVIDPLVAENVDFIGVQAQLGLDSWRKVIELAHAAERQVWGPIPRAASFDELLGAGQDGLLFLDGFLPPGRAWDGSLLAASGAQGDTSALDGEAFLELFRPGAERVATAGMRVVPVIRGHARLLDDPGIDPPELARLGPQFAARWSADLQARRTQLDEDYLARGRVAIDNQRRLVALLEEAGATLVPGSGAPHPWLAPGAGLHDELAEWEAAGVEPRVVLERATAGAARAFGIGNRGRIAPGQVADILVLSADPREDLDVLREPEVVVLRGEVRERSALDAQMLELTGRMAEERALASIPIDVPAPEAPDGEVLLSGRAETFSDAVRSSAEVWSIVRVSETKTTFCGRRIVPQGLEKAPVDIEVTQTLDGRALQSFEIAMRTGKHKLVVRGQLNGSRFHVERRVDGRFLDNKNAPGTLAAVDVGSVTTAMLLAHTRRPGRFQMLRFHEGLELEVVYWKLDVGEDGAHLFSTPQGPRLVALAENGAAVRMQEQRGAGTTETLNAIEATSVGLELPERTRQILEAAAARAVEARRAAAEEGAAPVTPGAPGAAPVEPREPVEPGEPGEPDDDQKPVEPDPQGGRAGAPEGGAFSCAR